MRSALALAIVLASSAPAAAQAPTLDQLLARFAAVEGMECRFREESRMAIMTTPIVTEGTVHYVRPGRLVRRVTRPTPSVVLIDGRRMQVRDGSRVETTDLAANSVVRTFVDTFSLLFSGQRAALEQVYRITYTPGSSGWSLVLTPRVSPLDQFLREVRFEGDGTTLRTMVMTHVTGDVATTRFEGVDTARRFTAEESARIFSLR